MNIYLSTFLTAVFSGLGGWLIASLKSATDKFKEKESKDSKELDALKDGVRALLHNRLFDFYTQYRDAASIPASSWREIDRVYNAYHDLGGNDTGSRIHELLRTKPLDPEE